MDPSAQKNHLPDRPDPSLLDDLLSRDEYRRFVQKLEDEDLRTT